MRIAVTFEDGKVFPHFGHTEQIKFYDIVDNAVAKSLVVPMPSKGPGSLLNFLRSSHVDLLICGGIGCGPRRALSQLGIAFCSGVRGDADDVVTAYLAGEFTVPSASACDSSHTASGSSCTCKKTGRTCSHTCRKHSG